MRKILQEILYALNGKRLSAFLPDRDQDVDTRRMATLKKTDRAER